MTDTQFATAADGRRLAFVEHGDPAGPPVFLFHGTPGSRLDHDPFDRPTSVRLIVPDRPGYGLSDPQPGRELVDWPADVVAIADELGLGRFTVAGISGGGPHALVCGALAPDRVERVVLVCGVGPLDREGADDGMVGSNAMLNELSRTDPAAVHAIGAAMAEAITADVAGFFAQGRDDLPAVDAAALDLPEVRAMMFASVVEAVRQGGTAFADEMCLLARSWGFEPAAITVPVHLLHGAEDLNVPLAHAQHLVAVIPGAELTVMEGEGHLSLPLLHSTEFIGRVVVG
jgi:pimeloyl-ACP methyl ester carboxylesterase